MQHPHNAETIREDVLTEWGIPLSKVLDILTDNGNNMVKAFHEQFCDGDKEEDEGLDESETIDFDKNKNVMRFRDSRSEKKAWKQGRDDIIKQFSTQLHPTYL